MKQILAPVLSNEEILPGTHLIWAQAPEIASEAEPGQFIMVRTSEGYDPLLRRPLSIHRVAPLPSPTQLALLFVVVGRGTKWLSLRQEGDMIDLLGPLGQGFEIGPQSRNLLLVAGGIGIAPLVALAERGMANGCRVALLLGAPAQAQLYPGHLLPSGVKLLVATEDGSAGRRGPVTDLLADLVPEADQVFACGPTSMYKSLWSLRRRKWAKKKSVQVSMEVRMGCGFGGCYGCAIETKRGLKLVCQDGPVFDLNDVIW